MNRYDSRVCLLDTDVLEQIHQEEMEAESSSSGYESSVSSDEEICLSISGSAPSSTNTTYSPTSTPREVMMFSSSGDLHDSLALITSMPELCDLTFLVGKERLPVHGVKAILATRSRCLYQLILHHQRKTEMERSNKTKSKKNRSCFLPNRLTIDVTDYQPSVFKKFINFVHSGKVKVDVNSVIGLLCASVEFGFRDLHTACLDFIKRCKDQGQRDIILDNAWVYQHKKAAQKLICQLSGVTR